MLGLGRTWMRIAFSWLTSPKLAQNCPLIFFFAFFSMSGLKIDLPFDQEFSGEKNYPHYSPLKLLTSPNPPTSRYGIVRFDKRFQAMLSLGRPWMRVSSYQVWPEIITHCVCSLALHRRDYTGWCWRRRWHIWSARRLTDIMHHALLSVQLHGRVLETLHCRRAGTAKIQFVPKKLITDTLQLRMRSIMQVIFCYKN